MPTFLAGAGGIAVSGGRGAVYGWRGGLGGTLGARANGAVKRAIVSKASNYAGVSTWSSVGVWGGIPSCVCRDVPA